MRIHPKITPEPRVRSQVLTKAFINATQLLDLKSLEVVNLAGMSPASWSRVVNHKRLITVDTKEAEFAVMIIRIYRSLDALFGGNEARAREWLRSYNHYLQGTPVELLQKLEGLVNVVIYLDAMRGLA